MDHDLAGFVNARKIKTMLHEDKRFRHIHESVQETPGVVNLTSGSVSARAISLEETRCPCLSSTTTDLSLIHI